MFARLLPPTLSAALAACAPAPETDPPRGGGDEPAVTTAAQWASKPAEVLWAECTPDAGNALRATCRAGLSRPAPMQWAIAAGDRAAVFTSEAAVRVHTVPVWGLVAETAWTWTATAGVGPPQRGVFVTGALPDALADVRVAVEGEPARLEQALVLAGCVDESYVVAVDGRGDLRWYNGFIGANGDPMPLYSYQWTAQSTVLATGTFDMAEVDVLGREVWHLSDVPLLMHHDGFRQGDLRYVLQADTYLHSDGLTYVEDLVVAYDGEGIERVRWEEHDHLDPIGQGTDGDQMWGAEFPGAIDAWHTNAIWVDPSGDFVLSLKQSNTVLRVDGGDGSLQWVLDGNGIAGSVPPATVDVVGPGSRFTDQHNVRLRADGGLSMFDNGSVGRVRGLDLALDLITGEATMVGEWALPDLACPIQSSFYELPDDHRLLTCTNAHTVVELDPAGTETWRAALSCEVGEIGRTWRGHPVDLWSLRVGEVVASHAPALTGR